MSSSINISNIRTWFFVLMPATFYFDRRISSVCLILLLVLSLPEFVKVDWKGLMKRKSLMFSIIFFLLYLISVLYTDDTKDAWRDVESMLPFVGLPIIGFVLFDTKGLGELQLSRIYKFFILIAVLAMSACLLHAVYAVKWGNGTWTWWFFYRGLSTPIKLHPIYFAYYLNFVLAILLFYENLNWDKWIKWSFVGYVFVFIVLLSARTPLLGTLVILGYFILTKLEMKWKVIGLLLLLLASSVLIWKFKARFNELFDDSNQLSFPRIETWKGALEVAGTHWLTGVSSGDLDEELTRVYEKNGYAEGVKFHYNCHNQYLQMWCTLGVAGFVFFLLWMFNVWKRIPIDHTELKMLMVVLLIGFLTESVLTVNKGVIFASYFFTIIACYGKQQN